VADDLDLVSEMLPDLLDNGGLSRSAASCDSHHIDISHKTLPFPSCFEFLFSVISKNPIEINVEFLQEWLCFWLSLTE
jgi:hypothetical protein